MPLLSEIDGWTPVIDELARERGLISAAVFGVVWRHCQLDNKVCHASLETMADKIGVHRTVVLKHIKKLCADGYLKDMTPGIRHIPHTYADTGKIALRGEVKAVKGVAHSTPSVAHSDLKRLFKETHEETGRESPPAFSQSFEELAKRALVIYSDTAQIKLDKTQAGAITNLIKAEPEFNFTRWVAACTSVKLGGVKPENVQCRIDTYKAGGNYQAMISAKRNGNGAPDAPAPKVELRGIDPAAYRAQLEADRAAATETKEMVNKTFEAGVTAAGLDVEQAIRKAKRNAKKEA